MVQCRKTETLDDVYVAVVIFDLEGNPIYIISTNVMESIQPGQKIGFEANSIFMDSNISTEDISKFEVYAYPYVWEEN